MPTPEPLIAIIVDASTGKTIEKQLTQDEIASFVSTPEQQQLEQLEMARKARQVMFQAEADPLYFGWQRGENTEQAWLDKVAEIRARFPYAE